MFDRTRIQSFRGALLCGAAAGALLLVTAPPAPAQGLGAGGGVFTATNDAQGNAVVYFQRRPSGRLDFQGVHPTGGLGSGAGLGNQGAVTLDAPGTHLLAVNAGDDSVSAFRVRPRGLDMLDRASSGGTQPISVTVHGDLVYVLNAGGDGNISGLQLDANGDLTPLAGSTQPLSGSGTGPAQIAFTPGGRFLVVTEKATNTIVTYPMGPTGLPGAPVVSSSAGVTPFGFSFGPRSRLLVSEAAGGMAGMSTVSSYDILSSGALQPITAALPTTQSAACWLVSTHSLRYSYVTNTGSGVVTGLANSRNGSLQLLQPTGATARSGNAPIDAAVSRDDRFLYVLNGADATISGYAIQPGGGLTLLDTMGGLPPSVNGLAVR